MAGGERTPPRDVFSSVAGGSPARSVWLIVVGFAKTTGLPHLAKEEELVDLLESPVRVADGDPRHEGREVGCLVRRHPLQQEVTVSRPGGHRSRSLRLELRGRCDGARPRHGRGGRREDWP